jgi:hypothetical protein
VKEEYRSSGVQRGCYVETVLISRRQSLLFCSSGEGRTAAGMGDHKSGGDMSRVVSKYGGG